MARIRIVNTKIVKTGTSAAGKAWTLSEVDATKLDGTPIDLKLKTFDSLAGEVDVEFEEQNHEKYGKSYMLKKVGGGGGGGGGQQQAATSDGFVHEAIRALQTRVTALEARVDKLTQPTPPDIPAELPPTPAATADDDIPF